MLSPTHQVAALKRQWDQGTAPAASNVPTPTLALTRHATGPPQNRKAGNAVLVFKGCRQADVPFDQKCTEHRL
jgi:hypothetical protein